MLCNIIHATSSLLAMLSVYQSSLKLQSCQIVTVIVPKGLLSKYTPIHGLHYRPQVIYLECLKDLGMGR